MRRIWVCLTRDPGAWEAIGSEDWVLSVLCFRYRIPFASHPPVMGIPQNFGSYLPGSERGKALDLEVLVLQDKEAVEASMTPGFYS